MPAFQGMVSTWNAAGFWFLKLTSMRALSVGGKEMELIRQSGVVFLQYTSKTERKTSLSPTDQIQLYAIPQNQQNCVMAESSLQSGQQVMEFKVLAYRGADMSPWKVLAHQLLCFRVTSGTERCLEAFPRETPHCGAARETGIRACPREGRAHCCPQSEKQRESYQALRKRVLGDDFISAHTRIQRLILVT